VLGKNHLQTCTFATNNFHSIKPELNEFSNTMHHVNVKLCSLNFKLDSILYYNIIIYIICLGCVFKTRYDNNYSQSYYIIMSHLIETTIANNGVNINQER